MQARILEERNPRRKGVDATSVVYVPGIDGTGEMLLATAERIEERFHLVRLAYDPDPEGPREAALYHALADSVIDRMTDAGVERAILLAESFGGGVALTAALRHPQRVEALMLVNTFCYYPRRIRIRLGAALVPFTPKRFLSLGRRTLAGKLFFRPRKDPEAEALFREAIPGFARGGYADRMQAIPHLDLRRRLKEVTQPCALFAATHDAVVPSKKTMRVLAAGLPNAELTWLERANHLVLPLREEPWPEWLAALHERAQG
ncbi:MAG: alpha/beta hydrolase [Planctomycetota bacterium]